MRLIPMTSAFVIALLGAVAVGLKPGYPFGTLVFGATIVAAVTGIAASVLQFLPDRHYALVAVVAGVSLGFLVARMMGIAEALGFGDVRRVSTVVWPTAVVAALLISRAFGMHLPRFRRR